MWFPNGIHFPIVPEHVYLSGKAFSFEVALSCWYEVAVDSLGGQLGQVSFEIHLEGDE